MEFPHWQSGAQAGRADCGGLLGDPQGGEETPASALAVLQCLYDAGLPPDVAQAVFGVPDEVSRHLLRQPVIRKLSFTGSTTVGKSAHQTGGGRSETHHDGTGRTWSGAGLCRCRS
jgi:succinate-semialdehyde dehydrogenase/glutarate-semialdehyde dehydrogenase